MLNLRTTAMRSSALAWALAALALPHHAVAAEQAAGASETAAAETRAASGGEQVEEVVVTARKRVEDLQSTPIAISAYSGEALAAHNVATLDDISRFTPSLQIYSSPTNSGVSNAAAYIRGVGQNDFSPGLDPGVGIYFDGIYLGRSVGALLDLLDVQRVEVLRGPQGTLFGRNTIGGAISIIPNRPQDTFGGSTRIRVGSDSQLNLETILNLPIASELSTRLVAASYHQDGYVKRPADNRDLGNKDTLTGRFSVRWQPTDALTADLAFDATRDRSNGTPQVLTGVAPVPVGSVSQVLVQNVFFSGVGLTSAGANPFACFAAANAANPNCLNNQFVASTRDNNQGTGPSYANYDVAGVSLNLAYDLSPSIQLRSISGFRSFDGEFAVDRDASPLIVTHVADFFEQKQWSQELQLVGSSFGDRLNWILGGYYFHEEGSDRNEVDLSAVTLVETIDFDVDSYAVFAQGTLDVTEQLSITAGVRGTRDSKSYLPDDTFVRQPLAAFGITFTCLDPVTHVCANGDRIVPLAKTASKSTNWSPMVNLSYDWTDDVMTYVTFSQGFKSGGVTQRVFPPEPDLPVFEPETVDSYEAGLKLRGLGRRLQINLAGYHTTYKDQQIAVSGPPRIGSFISNVGQSKISGAEVEVILTPGAGFRLEGSAAWTDARFDKLPPPNPDGTPRVPNITTASRFENISEWTISAQVSKTIPLSGVGTFVPRLSWNYRSDYFTNDNNFNVAALHQPDLHLVNASARLDLEGHDVSIEAGVSNIGNRKYRVNGSYQDGIGLVVQGFDRGRQTYMKLEYRY